MSSQLFTTTLLPFFEEGESQYHFSNSNSDAYDDENDDDPCDVAHFAISNTIAQNLGKFKENAAAFVEDFDAG